MIKKLLNFFKSHRLKIGWFCYYETQEWSDETSKRHVLWRWVKHYEDEEEEKDWDAWLATATPEEKEKCEVLQAYHSSFAVNSFLVDYSSRTQEARLKEYDVPQDLSGFGKGKTVQVNRMV